MGFYERFIKLCEERGISPSAVTKAIGIGTANATYWKKGSIPSGETVLKLSKYFGVTTDFLLGISNFRYPFEPDEEEKEKDKKDYKAFAEYIESIGYQIIDDPENSGETVFLIRKSDNFWYDLPYEAIGNLSISIKTYTKFQIEDLLSTYIGENPEHS